MNTDTSAATIGHNQPPEGLPAGPESIREAIRERREKLFARKDDLVAGSRRMPESVEDDETAGKVGDFIKQVNAARKSLEDARKADKQPYLDGGKAVDALFKPHVEGLDGVKAQAQQLLTAYQRRVAEAERQRREEEARRAREEAERKAAEAQTAADDEAARRAAEEARAQADQTAQEAASPAPAPSAKSAHGTSVSTRKIWTFGDLDPAQIDLEALRPYLPPAAIEQALRAFIKDGGREIAGARIFQDERVNVR